MLRKCVHRILSTRPTLCSYSIRFAKDNEIPVVDKTQIREEVQNAKEVIFSVDRSNLKDKTYEIDQNIGKEMENGLAKHLKLRIKAAGAISVSTFMNEALTNNQFGYYRTGSDQSIFGRHGDFITSPELSQMFGEVSALNSFLSRFTR
jgi:hypothetical protein